ncbi:MAG: hypothetical protein ABI390_10045 [Daejeonella sp.]
MKNSIFLLAVFTTFWMFGCNQAQNNNSQTADETKTATSDRRCYVALTGTDTADLKITTAKDGKVTGDLLMKYGVKPNEVERVINKGKVEGNFHGDTLFLNYLYTSGNLNNTLYQNPLALLKNGDQLILGVGEIQNSVGRSYFVKNKPIDFEKGRFKFMPADCK